MTPTTATAQARCLAPHCGRKLTSAKSVARGYGDTCGPTVRTAAAAADLSAWTPAQVEDARQAIEDGAVVPSNREGVFHVVSSDGTEVYRTHRNGCVCTNGLQTLPPRPCWHRCAVVIVLASQAPVPVAPEPTAREAIPAPAHPVWDVIDRITSALMTAA